MESVKKRTAWDGVPSGYPTKRVDQFNEHQHLIVQALEEANKEKSELRQLIEAQKEIESLKVEVKTGGETTVQNNIDNSANYWGTWNANELRSYLMEATQNWTLQKEFEGA